MPRRTPTHPAWLQDLLASNHRVALALEQQTAALQQQTAALQQLAVAVADLADSAVADSDAAAEPSTYLNGKPIR